ncbi:hypothetical protein FNF27_03871 [Cafeteria roenbergensis]|uniref:Dynein axonemal assembly factor 5 TPR repeats domain-containing protein n=1 Tax=Cafeteria roenbergensis TaxID=33653 RepID=A0A5A8EBV5_CAFRO|nr:hypothetical protein FNF27_03871 [Cafeteria roenbergensis]
MLAVEVLRRLSVEARAAVTGGDESLAVVPETAKAAAAAAEAGPSLTSASPDTAAFLAALRRPCNALSSSSSPASERFAAACDIARMTFSPDALAGLAALNRGVAPSAMARCTPAPAGGPTAGLSSAPPGPRGEDATEPDSDDEDADDGATAATAAAAAAAAATPAAVGSRAAAALAAAWDGPLHRPLLARLADASQRVRTAAATLLAAFLAVDGAVFDLTETLPLLLPALLERCCPDLGYDPQEHTFIDDMAAHEAHRRGRVIEQDARVPVVEPSEETRLELCLAVSALLDRAVASGSLPLLRPAAHRLVAAAFSFARDSAPAVSVRGCGLVQAVAAALPAAFRPFAPGLAKGLGPSLNHRLWRVRVAALGALDACVSTVDPLKRKGAGTEAIQPLVGHRDDNVIPIRAFYKGEVTRNRFAPLSLDPVPAVRRRFFAAVSSWLWSLPDRMDHESRLLPYLLTALADEDDDIAAAAGWSLWAIGGRYEDEQGEKLLERLQHGVDGDPDRTAP